MYEHAPDIYRVKWLFFACLYFIHRYNLAWVKNRKMDLVNNWLGLGRFIINTIPSLIKQIQSFVRLIL